MIIYICDFCGIETQKRYMITIDKSDKQKKEFDVCISCANKEIKEAEQKQNNVKKNKMIRK